MDCAETGVPLLAMISCGPSVVQTAARSRWPTPGSELALETDPCFGLRRTRRVVKLLGHGRSASYRLLPDRGASAPGASAGRTHHRARDRQRRGVALRPADARHRYGGAASLWQLEQHERGDDQSTAEELDRSEALVEHCRSQCHGYRRLERREQSGSRQKRSTARRFAVAMSEIPALRARPRRVCGIDVGHGNAGGFGFVCQERLQLPLGRPLCRRACESRRASR